LSEALDSASWYFSRCGDARHLGGNTLLGEAFDQFGAELVFVQVAPDKNELAGAGFVFLPKAIPEDAEAVVYAMKKGATGMTGEAEEALGAIDFFAFGEVIDPLLEAFHVEGLIEGEGIGNDVVMMTVGEFVEEGGVEGEFAFDIEDVHIEEFLEVGAGVVGAKEAGLGVEAGDFGFDAGELGVIDEVDFIDENEVGHDDLFAGDFLILHLDENLLGIDDGDDGVEADEFLEGGDIGEGLGDGAGVGDAGGLDEKVVEAAALEESLDAFDEVFADGAADAAVVQFEEFVALIFDELPVDPDFADFVDDDGKFIVVLLFENVIEEGGFTSAEEAGEDGDGDDFLGHEKEGNGKGGRGVGNNAFAAREWFPMWKKLDQPGFFEGDEGTVFGDGFKAAGGDADGDEFVEFGHPDAFILQIGGEGAGDVFGDVTAYAAFFLGHTATMNNASA